MRRHLLRGASLLCLISAALGTARAADLPSAPTLPPAAASASGAYQLNLVYTGELWADVAGGLQRGNSYMYNFDAQLQVDTGKALGWTGGTFVAEGFYANATSTGNNWVGALDQQSPIDTAANVPMFRLYQLYYDQDFGGTDVRFGIYDLETEFSNTKPMALFMSKDLTWNTALDQSGTMPENGTVGPGNYPYTPLALRVRQHFTTDFSMQFVVADGASDNPNNLAANGVPISPKYGALFMGEADYQPNKYEKLMVGAWDMTSQLPVFGQYNSDGSQRMTWGEYGAYVGGATRLYSAGGRRGLDGFFTLGYSEPESNNVVASLNGGLVYTGLFDARPADKVGVSFNINEASNYYKQFQFQNGVDIVNYETSIEATYRLKINDYLTVQPDVQYIVKPFYSPTTRNALVLGFHFELGKLLTW